MSDFAIYADKLGAREDVPTVLLSEVFLSTESRNIHDEYGEWRKMRGRVPLLWDEDSDRIQAPIFHDAVTVVSVDDKKFTIAGAHETAIDDVLESSDDQIRINASTDNDGLYTVVSVTEVGGTITDVVVGTSTFTIAGNHASEFADVSSFNVTGSTGSLNDGAYTKVSATDNGGNTDIVVSETIPSEAVADGTLSYKTEIVVSEAPTSTTADGNLFAGGTPIICFHNYTKSSTGADYLLCGTAYHVWLWNNTSQWLTLKFTSANPSIVSDMVMATHLDYVYMTNNVDLIQWWDTTSTSKSFEDAGSSSGIDIDGSGTYITKAKHLYSFKTYLFIGFVTYSTNSVYPQRAHWGGRGTVGDYLDLDRNGSSDANFKDFNHEPSAIVGFKGKDTNLVVAKNESIAKGWLVTADTVFEWDEETIKRGCISGKTLVNDKAGLLYYLCSDFTLRELDTPDPLSSTVDKTMKDINPEFADYSQATYVDEYKSIFFAVPTDGSETNDLVIEFNTITATCYLHDIPVRAFAGYRRQDVYGYSTMLPDTEDRDYTAWGLDWLLYDLKVNVLGFPLDICSDYNGNTYVLHESDKDDGADWTGKLIISTTLTPSKSLYVYKRAPNGMDITFNRQSSGTIVVRVKKDSKAWESIGSVNLIGDEDETEDVSISHLPFDKRARVFYFELSSTGNLELLGLVFREFYFDGDR